MIEFTEQAMRVENIKPLPMNYPYMNQQGVSISKSDVDTASYIIMNKINIKGQLIACDGLILTKAISLAIQYCNDISKFQQLVFSVCVRIHAYTFMKCARSRAAELKTMRELFIETRVQANDPIDQRDELSPDFKVKVNEKPKRKDRMSTSYIGCPNELAPWDTLTTHQQWLLVVYNQKLESLKPMQKSRAMKKSQDYLSKLDDITASDIVSAVAFGLFGYP